MIAIHLNDVKNENEIKGKRYHIPKPMRSQRQQPELKLNCREMKTNEQSRKKKGLTAGAMIENTLMVTKATRGFRICAYILATMDS